MTRSSKLISKMGEIGDGARLGQYDAESDAKVASFNAKVSKKAQKILIGMVKEFGPLVMDSVSAKASVTNKDWARIYSEVHELWTGLGEELKALKQMHPEFKFLEE